MQYRRIFIPGASYFFTVVAELRRPILSSASAVDVLRNAFRTVRKARPFEVEASGRAARPLALHLDIAAW